MVLREMKCASELHRFDARLNPHGIVCCERRHSQQYRRDSRFSVKVVNDVPVQVSDSILINTQALSVTITDVSEFAVTAPVDTIVTENSVTENPVNGTTVGITAFSTGADAKKNAVTYSLSLSVGYVVRVLRGRSLLTSFFLAMQAWQAFDPLPVLQSFKKKNEDDTLLSIVTRRIVQQKKEG